MTESLSDKIFLGNRASDMDTGDIFQITRVNLNVDSDNYYTAGNDTGQTIEVTCPWGTQEMANSILASLQGKKYQPYTAIDTLLDPAAEIGDAVTVGGTYSVIASIDTVFDRACAPSISAPESDEIDDEYPYESRERKETNRQLAQTRSLISKTSEEILLQVENELEGLSSSFSVQLQQIQSQVTGLNGQVSSITQKVDNITLSVSNGSTSSSISLSVGGVVVSSQNIQMNGLVTFTGLANGTTTIDGACLATGTVIADVEVKGSKFSNTAGSAYLEVGGTDYGDMTLYGQGGNRVFRVYDNVGSVSLSGYGVEFLRISDLDETCYPQGDWDFRSANVSGITATFA